MDLPAETHFGPGCALIVYSDQRMGAEYLVRRLGTPGRVVGKRRCGTERKRVNLFHELIGGLRSAPFLEQKSWKEEYK